MKIEITPEMRARLMHAKHIVIGISDCVPDGYRVVPVEPTREMCEAFHLANGEYLSGKNSELMSPVHQWNAMLDAAPEFKLVDVSGGAA